MALVAYDYDSNSESEDDEKFQKTTSRIIVKESVSKIEANFDEVVAVPEEIKLQSNETTGNLFSSLPQTKTVVNKIGEDQIEDFIPKSKPVLREKQKVKITIPSLSQFTDIEEGEPQVKKLKSSSKGSGLISILPPVKGTITTTKTFVPNVITVKKKNINSDTTNSTGTSTRAKCYMPETFDDEMWEKVCGRPKHSPKPKQIIQELEETPQECIDIAPEPEQPYEGLDNKAFKELVGRSKRPIGNIKLIDVNEEEILPEKDLWMTKSLTDPEMAPKPQIEEPVDPTRRKKHHITYLAQQAKANEQELQNAWSASKNNRMATRAKYGF
ncbi:hypothetical protein NQ314_006899 [Rhamnusium bicolor]|uniref:Proline-rich protein PRCC n=1 Tax=Rhamnusium bicolor TaxID=1586634 RepID=A0AAV8YUX8_9CUCU|nr:hypothetical protein NQ314_006899 [Rhamnusium bicolor]